PGGWCRVSPVALDELAGPDPLRVHALRAREHREDQLLLGQFHGEDPDPAALLLECAAATDVRRDVEAERRVVREHEVRRDIEVIVAVDEDALTRFSSDRFDRFDEPACEAICPPVPSLQMLLRSDRHDAVWKPDPDTEDLFPMGYRPLLARHSPQG